MYTNSLVTEQVAEAYLAAEKRQTEAWQRNFAIRRKGDTFGWLQRLVLSLQRLARRKDAHPEARPTLATPTR